MAGLPSNSPAAARKWLPVTIEQIVDPWRNCVCSQLSIALYFRTDALGLPQMPGTKTRSVFAISCRVLSHCIMRPPLSSTVLSATQARSIVINLLCCFLARLMSLAALNISSGMVMVEPSALGIVMMVTCFILAGLVGASRVVNCKYTVTFAADRGLDFYFAVNCLTKQGAAQGGINTYIAQLRIYLVRSN